MTRLPPRLPEPPPPYEIRHGASWDLSGIRTPAFVAGSELADLADADPRVVVLTADLAYSNRTFEFAERHPDRFFNVGIAEQNMVSMAAGMATCGWMPFVATFASFVGLLCAEQLRTDVAYSELPVRVLAHHSGMALGFYGTSHHALEDIGIMRSIAGMRVVSATDEHMLRSILRFSLTTDEPLYVRMGRGRDPQVYSEPPAFALGISHRLTEGDDVAILACGAEVAPALDAARLLREQDGVHARVVDLASLWPVDADAILEAARDCGRIVTVEEHNITGGLGTTVCEVLADAGVAVPLRRHGIGDEYVLVGPPAGLYAHYRLDGPGVAEVTRELLRETG
jgi:transketolase